MFYLLKLRITAIDWFLIQVSTGKLPPAADRGNCRDPQPDIQRDRDRDRERQGETEREREC